MQLGLFQFGEPSEESAEPARGAPRHRTISAMIAEKTRGNLALEEQRIIENSLTELRFRFVQVAEQNRHHFRQTADKPADKPADQPAEKSANRGRARVVLMPETLRITVLGSGTSSGVPTIGCSCATCASTDPRDNRLRPSALVQYGGKNVLIDTTPDFRAQALRAGIGRVDTILYTHAHADHILGLTP